MMDFYRKFFFIIFHLCVNVLIKNAFHLKTNRLHDSSPMSNGFLSVISGATSADPALQLI